MSRWLRRGLALVAVLTVALLLSLTARARMSASMEGPLTRFAPCPETPNCVSSDAPNAPHAIAPFELAAPPSEAWSAVLTAVLALPGIGELAVDESYLHAACSSRWLGFVDDLEIELRAAEGVLAVRSASRVGRSDLGANRRRLETLRAKLVDQGVVR